MADPATNSSNPAKDPNAVPTPEEVKAALDKLAKLEAELADKNKELEKERKERKDQADQHYKQMADLKDSINKTNAELLAIRKADEDKKAAEEKAAKDKELMEGDTKMLVIELTKKLDLMAAEKEKSELLIKENFTKQIEAQRLTGIREKLLLLNPDLVDLADELVPNPLKDPNVSVTEQQILDGIEKAKTVFSNISKKVEEKNKVTPKSLDASGNPLPANPATGTTNTIDTKKTLEALTAEFYSLKDNKDPRYESLRTQILEYYNPK